MVKKKSKKIAIVSQPKVVKSKQGYWIAGQYTLGFVLTFLTPGILNVISNNNLPRPTIFSGPYLSALTFSLIVLVLSFTSLRERVKSFKAVILILVINTVVYSIYNGNNKVVMYIYLLVALSLILWKEKDNFKEKFTFSYPALVIPLGICLLLAGLQAQANVITEATLMGTKSGIFSLPSSGSTKFKVTVNNPSNKGEETVTYEGKFNWQTCQEEGTGLAPALKKIKYGINKEFHSYDFEKQYYITDATKVGLKLPTMFSTYPVASIVSTQQEGVCNNLKLMNQVSFKVGNNKYKLDAGVLSKLASYETWKEVNEVYKISLTDKLIAYYNLTYMKSLDRNYNDFISNYAYFELNYETSKLVGISMYLYDPINHPGEEATLLEKITFEEMDYEYTFTPNKVIDFTEKNASKGLF